jgi:hypothetical protein
MESMQAPLWCQWRRGRSAVLVIAPHGGRREPAVARRPGAGARPRKVNDLHTADVAVELADALDASLIVNPTLDRNQLDLNRITQVAARAPWFLALIEALLDDILTRHPRSEILVVHGWNVIQAKCDIGIGRALAAPTSALEHAAALTTSPDYAVARLGRLQELCAAAGIAVAFGERYPAGHPNNLLQLFRAGACASAPPRVQSWAAARRIDAVQLELGVPLRWPGPHRQTFVRAATAVFNGGANGHLPSDATAARPRLNATPAPSTTVPPSPASLQLYDPRAGIGLTARIDIAQAMIAGRVLLFLGGQRVALFLGEDARGVAAAAGDQPQFIPTDDGFDMRFAGTALANDDGALYVDLEQAFAASQLCSVAVELTFRRGLSAHYGPATGWIEVDGDRREIAAPAFSRHGVLQRSAGAWSSQLTLSAAFGPRLAVRVRHEFPGRGGVVHELTGSGETEAAQLPLTVHFGSDRHTPEQIVVGDGSMLHCQPLSRMAITRPLPPHRQARVTFGTARFVRDGQEGFGFYEYARAMD